MLFFSASIASRSDLSVSFINITPGPGSRVHLNPQMRGTGRRIRIGPESHRSRSDRSRNRNPLKIRTRILLYSCTNPVLLFARVLDTHPALAHILMWVCGSAACTRREGVCVLADDEDTHTHDQMYIMQDSRCVLSASVRISITVRIMKAPAAGEVSMETDARLTSLYCILKTVKV